MSDQSGDPRDAFVPAPDELAQTLWYPMFGGAVFSQLVCNVVHLNVGGGDRVVIGHAQNADVFPFSVGRHPPNELAITWAIE